MLDRLIGNLDFLPGGKTYWLAGACAALYWGEMVGLIPAELAAEITPWLLALMGPTVALKLAR